MASERRIAFCVGQWSADATLYSWTYTKQYFLKKVKDSSGSEALAPSEKLFVVHVVRAGNKERWDAGGPLLPNLSMALQHFPHKVVELEREDSVHSTLLEFAEKNAIDILILGSRENKGTVQKLVPGTKNLGSTSDNVKSRAKMPVLIIRPASARNEKMRIRSIMNVANVMDHSSAQPPSSLPHSATSLPPALKAGLLSAQRPPEPRRIAIAFDSSSAGRHTMAWASKMLLVGDDEIFLVRTHPRVGARQISRARSMAEKSGSLEHSLSDELDTLIDNSRFKIVGSTEVKGDIKDQLCDFAEEHAVDLLVVAASSSVGLKKAFGTSTSSHLAHHAPCPTLVLPIAIANPGGEAVGASQDLDHRDEEAEVGELPSRISVGNRPHSPTTSSQEDSDESAQRLTHTSTKGHDRGSTRSSVEENRQAVELTRMRQQLQDKDIKIDALQAQVRQLQQQLAGYQNPREHASPPHLRQAVSYA
ncbi:hypothetical protein WJX73_002927 [Symbiochloris irregularis]|uniref:UspA domain-containing protein n=1 Tax=Symbiochloris irregularis TaxID=706552 RepID=A0AAW1PYP7_9CHLO